MSRHAMRRPSPPRRTTTGLLAAAVGVGLAGVAAVAGSYVAGRVTPVARTTATPPVTYSLPPLPTISAAVESVTTPAPSVIATSAPWTAEHAPSRVVVRPPSETAPSASQPVATTTAAATTTEAAATTTAATTTPTVTAATTTDSTTPSDTSSPTILPTLPTLPTDTSEETP